MPSTAGAAGANKKTRKKLSADERRSALDQLLARSTNGAAKRGDFGVVGAQFGTTRFTMTRLWKQFQEEKAVGKSGPGGNSGRKRRDMAPYVQELHQIPLKLRTTLRSTAAAIGLSKSTFRRRMPFLGVKPHKRFLKPLLTNAVKIARLRWARRWTNAPIGGLRKFNGMMRRVVHVGDKRLCVCKDGQNYHLFSDEEPPTRKVRYKSHTNKVMFLGAVARPQ
ncbi:unnamed protein product, partial [Ectocarpus sp. 12 AP-2014]